MQLKFIQTELKKAGFNMTQKDIATLLDRLKIDFRDMPNSGIGELIETVKKNQNQLAIRENKGSKVTLKLPDELENEVVEVEQNTERQAGFSNEFNERLVKTADALSDHNRELVVNALPELTRIMTYQKLQQAQPEIEAKWQEVNDELMDAMFGL